MAARLAPGQDRIDPKVLKSALILVIGALARHLRHHDRQRRAAYPGRAAAHVGADGPVGDDRLSAGARHGGAAVRVGAAALRRQAVVDVRRSTVFGIGSIGSSLAWNTGSLIAWRVVQGAGGGILFPLLTTLIMQAAGGKALGRTVTIIALPALLGPILGPLVGGAILTHCQLAVHVLGQRAVLRRRPLPGCAAHPGRRSRPGQARGRTWTCWAWLCSPPASPRSSSG